MPDKSKDLNVTDNPAEHRFEARIGDEAAFLSYTRRGNSLILVHTEVPPALQRQGIGSRLAAAALEHARKAGLSVRPQCPFVAGYIERHPEYADLVRRRTGGTTGA